MSDSHWLDVRDKSACLRRLMTELAGDARISLEGDLSRCRFDEEIIVSREETPVLKRNTLMPEQDFVVLRIELTTVEAIMRQVLAAGLAEAIIHVQIERSGVLELGAYDSFRPECTICGPGASFAALSELKASSIIHDFGTS